MTQRWVVARLGTAQTLAWASTYYLPAILAVPMAADLGIAPATVFLAFSAGLGAQALLGPAAGRRIDRLGGRGTLAATNLVFALGLTLMALAQGPLMLTLAWVVTGAAMAFGLYEAAFATLAGLYGREARRAITGVTLIAGFASTVGWPVTTAMEAWLGWRGACLGWAVLHLALALPLNLSLPRGRMPAAPPSAAAPPPPGADPVMLLMGGAFAASWFVSTAMAAHLPRLLETAGATPAAALAAAALLGPAQVAARLMEAGYLSRLHPVISARGAAACHPVAAAVLLAAGGPAASGFAVLHGAGMGLLTIARGTMPLALYGAEGYGLRQGLLAIPVRVAAVLAPASFALLIDRFGAGALWFSMALGVLSTLALVAIPSRARQAPR